MRRIAHHFLRKQRIKLGKSVILVLHHIAFAQPYLHNLSSDPYGATFFQKKACSGTRFVKNFSFT